MNREPQTPHVMWLFMVGGQPSHAVQSFPAESHVSNSADFADLLLLSQAFFQASWISGLMSASSGFARRLRAIEEQGRLQKVHIKSIPF